MEARTPETRAPRGSPQPEFARVIVAIGPGSAVIGTADTNARQNGVPINWINPVDGFNS